MARFYGANAKPFGDGSFSRLSAPPIGIPAVCATEIFTFGSARTSETLTNVNVTAGNSIFIMYYSDSAQVPTSITDSVGNVYAVNDVSQTSGTARISISSAHNVNALSSGTITVNFASNSGLKVIDAIQCSGIASATADEVITGSGATASWTCGPTGVLDQPNELALYGVLNDGDPTANTPDAGWTDLYDVDTGQRQWIWGYGIRAATTAVTASGTAGNNAWVSMLATYRGRRYA